MSKSCGWTSALILVVLAVLTGVYSFAEEEEEAEVATEVPVRIGRIRRATLHGYVVAYGTVELAPHGPGQRPASARISTPVAGVIAETDCAEGQIVAKGDVLFRLDTRVAEIAVNAAKEAVGFAEQNLERQKQLQQVEGTSKKLYEEAQRQLSAARADLAAAQTQLELQTIRAPLAGVVMQVFAKPGEAVDLSSVLAELMDLNRLVVTAGVPSRETPLLKIGQAVEFTTGSTTVGKTDNASPAHATEADARTHTSPDSDKSTASLVKRTGTLIFISPQVDPQTDTIEVRASVPPGAGLRLGQFVKTRIRYEERKNCLVVPKDSVVTDADGHSVVALVNGDKAVMKSVKAGLHEDDLVEIEGEGFKEGMTIVTEGAYGLPDETKIREIGKQP